MSATWPVKSLGILAPSYSSMVRRGCCCTIGRARGTGQCILQALGGSFDMILQHTATLGYRRRFATGATAAMLAHAVRQPSATEASDYRDPVR
jgi:hypothetical protein